MTKREKPTPKPKSTRDLAIFIMENRHRGKFIVDNDMWWFETEYDPEDEDAEVEILFESDNMEPWTGGYGGGNTYGGDILQALAILAGVKVESV